MEYLKKTAPLFVFRCSSRTAVGPRTSSSLMKLSLLFVRGGKVVKCEGDFFVFVLLYNVHALTGSVCVLRISLTAVHIESSSYGAVYLSPPLDNNWRRWVAAGFLSSLLPLTRLFYNRKCFFSPVCFLLSSLAVVLSFSIQSASRLGSNAGRLVELLASNVSAQMFDISVCCV